MLELGSPLPRAASFALRQRRVHRLLVILLFVFWPTV